MGVAEQEAVWLVPPEATRVVQGQGPAMAVEIAQRALSEPAAAVHREEAVKLAPQGSGAVAEALEIVSTVLASQRRMQVATRGMIACALRDTQAQVQTVVLCARPERTRKSSVFTNAKHVRLAKPLRPAVRIRRTVLYSVLPVLLGQMGGPVNCVLQANSRQKLVLRRAQEPVRRTRGRWLAVCPSLSASALRAILVRMGVHVQPVNLAKSLLKSV